MYGKERQARTPCSHKKRRQDSKKQPKSPPARKKKRAKDRKEKAPDEGHGDRMRKTRASSSEIARSESNALRRCTSKEVKR